jgi:hypothetical protein
MIVTVCCALSSYVLLGTALAEMAERVTQSARPGWPFDVTVERYLSDEEIDKIEAMDGLARLEFARLVKVLVGPTSHEVISVDTTDTAFVLDLIEGRLPQSAEEAAMPEVLAETLGLSVGDRVRMVSQVKVDVPQEYEVVGILSGKATVLTLPLLTSEGISRLEPLEKPNRALIQLDGTVKIERFGGKLSNILRTAKIHLETSGYSSVENVRSLSDTLVISLRSLILFITAASLMVLFYMNQRAGAYETGVLRAVGIRREWLLLPPIGATLVIFGLGLPLTGLILPVLSSQLGLHTDPAVLRSVMTKDMLVYVGVGLLSTLVVNGYFLVDSPIPMLLKDAW